MYDPSELPAAVGRVDQPTKVGNYPADRKWLLDVANSGFNLVINYTPVGFKYFDCTYSQEWQNEYVNRGYLTKDPIVISALSSFNTTKRWSEIRLPDLFKVFEASARFGLIYGLTVCRTRGFKRSLISLSRHDREFTDEEIAAISTWFDEFVDLASDTVELTAKEIEVVRLLALDKGLNEIASDLKISTPAVKARLKAARKRVGSKTNFSLVHKASRASLL